MSVYLPLQDFLSETPEASVALSYAEIEKLLGRPLPPSAKGRISRQWWANTDTHAQARAWLRAGRKAKLDVSRKIVTFVADHDVKAGDAADGVLISRKALTPAAIRLLEDIADERPGDLGAAAATLLNRAAAERRRLTLDWFAEHTVMSQDSAASLIRADRDAR